jgi:hypothetical protein
MKSKDFALIAVVVFISILVSFFVSKLVFAPSSDSDQQVEVVQPITADFPQPSNKYFNAQSNDPTIQITIGASNNTDPFSGTQQ